MIAEIESQISPCILSGHPVQLHLSVSFRHRFSDSTYCLKVITRFCKFIRPSARSACGMFVSFAYILLCVCNSSGFSLPCFFLPSFASFWRGAANGAQIIHGTILSVEALLKGVPRNEIARWSKRKRLRKGKRMVQENVFPSFCIYDAFEGLSQLFNDA